MSVITTLRAPTCLATSAPMMPIGPAPVTSTSSPTRSKDSAVCTALPSGSRIAADLVGDVVRDRHDIVRGIATYSAKAPGRLTPMPFVLRQRCPLPARQLRQWPQRCAPRPRRAGRSCIRHLRADVGDLADIFVAGDHRHRHRLLRPLVPIVDVDVGAADRRSCVTLMRTSFGPIPGTVTRSIQIPGSARL